MASTSPPKCPVLPDGGALTAAFVGMDKDRFSSMFADDVQVLCAYDCKIHPGAGPVDESFHMCMNCALKFHSCITCSGVRFADWIYAASAREMLSQCGQEKFDHYKDDFFLSPLELCTEKPFRSIRHMLNVRWQCVLVELFFFSPLNLIITEVMQPCQTIY